ncbi:hypothetical protein Taro_031686 [Colocasia esculenta]|uniref:RRM domain-containing protein n=1 Tax=Colocasia esculenta TaxID=4460 RepID=A0A843VZP5_COLES|nr:hypothetical protein [Colocasia esculenta]
MRRRIPSWEEWPSNFEATERTNFSPSQPEEAFDVGQKHVEAKSAENVSEVDDEVQNNSQTIVDSSPAPVLEEAPKKSYASIVKVMKENAAAPFLAPSARPAPVIPPRQTPTVATSSPAPEVPASGSHGAESGDVQEAEVEGHSIYIKNLPLNATVVQPEEEFKRFGPIRPDGVLLMQQQGFCFGFVEFEVPSVVQSAIEAPPCPNQAIEAREAERDDDDDLRIHDD